MEVPKIVSVDDHVVEPAHVWQSWLPEKHRALGPRVERKRWAPFVHHPGAKYTNVEDPEGEWGDAWYYEDRLIYVHKKFVAIPLSATPDGDVARFDRTVMTMTPVTYDGMRPGCYERDARVKDFELNWVDGSLPFPTFPRFCGQTFSEANDKELALACVRAYNDWMVEEWCEPSGGMNIPLCIMPLWDVDLAVAEIRRNAERGVRAFCFSELPTRLGLPTSTPGIGTRCSPWRTTPASRCACTSGRRRVIRKRRPMPPRESVGRWRSTTRWRRSPTGCSAGSSRSSQS